MKTANKQDPEWADEKFVTRNFGITHSPLFRLRKSGTIRSVSLRPEGASYGKRLYYVPSVREYIATMEARELELERAAR